MKDVVGKVTGDAKCRHRDGDEVVDHLMEAVP